MFTFIRILCSFPEEGMQFGGVMRCSVRNIEGCVKAVRFYFSTDVQQNRQ
jgi:hypothetical protein